MEDLKRGKSPSHDLILNEHVIYGGDALYKSLTDLFNAILYHERIPDSWRESLIIPIYKGKGKDKSDPASYRPISLIPCFCKIFEKLLINRVQNFLSRENSSFPNIQQQGFQKQLSCITAAFNLQEPIFHCVEKNSRVYVAFLDFKAAFDSVWHEGLFEKLFELGLKGKILRIIMNTYSDLSCRIRVNGMTSDIVKIERGVRQGGVGSTFYYLVYIDELLHQLQKSNCALQIGNYIKCGNPSFADDLSLIALSPHKLQIMLDICQ